MKLHIKRSQADVKGMFGGHKGVSFTLSLKLELSPEETSLIEKYAVWHYPLWERGQLPVTIEEQSFEQGDALRAEIESFIDCAREGRPPVVTGEDGLRALETAIRITREVSAGKR